MFSIVIKDIIYILQSNPQQLHDRNGVFQIELLVHSLDFQRRILDFLNNYSAALCKIFLTSSYLYHESKGMLSGDMSVWLKQATNHQIDHIIDGFDRVNYNYIQDQISDTDIDFILDDIVSVLTNPSRKFTVIGIVDGLDLEGTNIEIGNVRFYDSRIWSYGEGTWLDMHSPHAYRGKMEQYNDLYTSNITKILSQSQEYKGFYGNITDKLVKHGARFMVTIQASDEYVAREKALIQAQKMLELLMWIFRDHPAKGYGTKLSIVPFTLVISENMENIKKISDKNVPAITLLGAKEQQLSKYINFYQNILAISEEKRTRVENAVIRAIHWYIQAYWSENSTDGYLKYWIALEQLFVEMEPEKLKTIQDKLPQLVSTWEQTNQGKLILKSWKELIKAINQHSNIKSALDIHPGLNNWETHVLVIINNISILESVDNKNQINILPLFKSLLDDKIIIDQNNENRDNIKYVLNILNKRRNAIVHEGYDYDTDMGYYIQILKKHIDKAIDRAIGRIIYNTGKYQAIMDIALTYNTPW